MTHPYQHVADHQLWYRAVTWVPPGQLDPVVHPRFTVTMDDAIATMGSCFAQHLARHLARRGLHYLVTETAPDGVGDEEATARQYGTFTARFGNVYTTAQADQLLQRAFGEFTPVDEAWSRPDGRLVDPFRPGVEPDGFADLDALRADRATHLAAVRRMFEQADVLVFTLGLTEGWRSRADGAVYPTAPGVAGGSYDPAAHEFVNFDVDQVRASLLAVCAAARRVNPEVRVLLTVSPVPLVATYEDRHVLVSTVYSKSVLRVAAEAATRAFDFVDYFPSYELISSATGVRDYFADDRREVTETGVEHVMRTFVRHFVPGPSGSAFSPLPPTPSAPAPSSEVVCDEETILRAIDASR